MERTPYQNDGKLQKQVIAEKVQKTCSPVAWVRPQWNGAWSSPTQTEELGGSGPTIFWQKE